MEAAAEAAAQGERRAAHEARLALLLLSLLGLLASTAATVLPNVGTMSVGETLRKEDDKMFA